MHSGTRGQLIVLLKLTRDLAKVFQRFVGDWAKPPGAPRSDQNSLGLRHAVKDVNIDILTDLVLLISCKLY